MHVIVEVVVSLSKLFHLSNDLLVHLAFMPASVSVYRLET